MKVHEDDDDDIELWMTSLGMGRRHM